jgi:hypothetical protein
VLPPLEWLSRYERSWLAHDAVVGVTLAAYTIPASLAYAFLAGVPPQDDFAIPQCVPGGDEAIQVNPRALHRMAQKEWWCLIHPAHRRLYVSTD